MLHRKAVLHSAALAAALACAGTAQSAVTATGNTHTLPGNLAIGPGNTDLGNVGLFVGNGGTGALSVTAGSTLRTGSLLSGPSATGNGNGSVLVTGSNTKVELIGNGFSDGVINRLGVGEWGRGSLTVSAGAVLDGRANASACLGVNHYCNNFIGNAAGSDGTFTVTGTGSQASFLRGSLSAGSGYFTRRSTASLSARRAPPPLAASRFSTGGC